MTPMSTWKDHYWATVPCMKSRIEEIVRLVNGRGKTVLEIGCNEGFVSKALIEDGCIVTSADYSQEQLDKAKRDFGIEGVLADIQSLPFPDQHFDIAVSGETLEHITNPMKGLSELFRVAREKVLITLPVGEYWLGELTHQWQLNGSFIEHDTAIVKDMKKDILVLCWDRKRDSNFVDIPPFDTAELKRKHKIG